MTFIPPFHHILLVAILVISVSGIVSGNRCTEVLNKNEVREVVVKVPCITKYTARCGWISLNYCTFYDKTYCDKKKNETIKTYYIVTHCCKGYFMASNGSCTKKVPGVIYPEEILIPVSKPTEDPNYVEKKKLHFAKVGIVKDSSVISGGGYAGIICGLVLILCITGFVIIAIRKRKRNNQKKPGAVQSVMYVGLDDGHSPKGTTTGNESSVPRLAALSDATPAKQSLLRQATPDTAVPPREVTPTSTLTRTPPREVTPTSTQTGTPPREVTPTSTGTPPREVTPTSTQTRTPPREVTPTSTGTPPGSPVNLAVTLPLLSYLEEDDIPESNV